MPRSMLANAEKLRSMQIAGINRARSFSWQAMADETIKVYEEAALL